MFSDNGLWTCEPINIGERDGKPIIVTIGELFIAGVTKDDLEKMLNTLPPDQRKAVIEKRKEVGKTFTELGISTNMATQILINNGTMAYAQGCREQWAVYAHNKTNSRFYGCLIFIVIAIAILYFIFK